ncbi:uncharacterized protein [Lepeophtheirus salmonis]|uniref:uncharacterized protein isoform X1 n=1 Tax=Lepeophtheirus salmonis TaxID=72036 RepID=UPI001AE8F92B|nr:uncharacterized protein LOC121123622 isoform X1 [Lepeophtheirus salmonis]
MNNLFRSYSLIAILVGISSGEDACEESLDTGHGNCYSKTPGARYYYNYNSGNCEMFEYLGCEGNENRFTSEDTCLKTCAYTHNDDDDEEEISEFGDVYVINNGIVDDIHLTLFSEDKLSKGWFSHGSNIINKSEIQNIENMNQTSDSAKEYALIPADMRKTQLSTKIMSLQHHHFYMSFSIFMLDTSSSIKISIQKYSDLSSTVDSTYKIFDSKHYRKIIKKNKDWIHMRFALHDSVDMKYGGRLQVTMKKSTNISTLGLSNLNVTIVPLMSDRHYSINTGEEAVLPGLSGGILTTLEIILIVILILLAIFAVVLSYRHWSLRSHVKQYNLNNVSVPKSSQSNPVFSGGPGEGRRETADI